jgi:hypothetical protein
MSHFHHSDANYDNLADQNTRTGRNARMLAVLLGLCAFICLPLSLLGQIDTGSVTGTVTDSTGARLPHAGITLTNTKTGVMTSVLSTSSGTYVFEALNPGTYNLKATTAGFETYSVPELRINIQKTLTVDIVMVPGALTENVTVTTAAPLLEAQSNEVGQTVDEVAVNDLPLNGRNWTSLGQLAAGVTSVPGTPGGSFFSVNGVSVDNNDFRLNGIDDNIGQLVGGQVRGAFSGNTAVVPPPDAIEEFKLQNSNYDAEFGHATGGVINAVIKSGGNRVHGNLFEYVRNDIFDANDYFSKQNNVPIPEYRQNQFGGTVGGPVYIPKLYDGRNKTFFFFDYQATRIVQPSNSTSTVPTPLMQSSNFTNLQDLITYNQGTRTDALNRVFPLGTVFDPATIRNVAAGATDQVSGLSNNSTSAIVVSDPFFTGGSISGIHDFTGRATELNQLPSGRFDPNAVKLLQVYPGATNPAAYANNYYQTSKSPQTINQYDVRIDENIGSKDIIFGVFSNSYFHQFVPPTLPLSGGYGSGNVDFPAYSISLGYTHVFTPTLTNEFRFGFNHNYQDLEPKEGNTFGIPAQFGIEGVPQKPSNGGLPPISIGNLSEIGIQGWEPTVALGRTTELSDNVTKVYGSHTFKTGFEIQSMEGDITQPAFSRGTFNYSGQFSAIPGQNTQLTGISDALLVPKPSTVGGTDNAGGITSFSGTNWGGVQTHRYYMGSYLQDNWQLSNKLTLNLGIRWDLFTPYAEVNGRQANFNPTNGNGPGGKFYMPTKTCNNPVSSSFTTLLQKDGITLSCVPNLSLGTPQYSNFAPRVGFAYRVTPKLVVRGGFGIAYGALASIGYGGTLGTNYPFQYTVNLQSPGSSSPLLLPDGTTATMEKALNTIELQDPTKVNANGIGLEGQQFNYKTPYTESSNVTLQYQIDKSDSIQAAYVGVSGRHLDSQTSVANSVSKIVPPGAASIYDYIPFPDFAPNQEYLTTSGSSNYQSMQAVFVRQVTTGLTVLANYTYSKCLSDAGQFVSGIYWRAQWLPGFGTKKDWQLCPSDSTHVIHASGQYNLPIGRGQKFLGGASRVVDGVVGGWALNYIVTHEAGHPLTIGCPIATTAFFGCYANKVPGQNMYAGPHNRTQWLNPAAFANPPVATQIGQTDFSVLGGKGMQARAPGFDNVDASMFKKFSITESTNLQFRAEAFNLFNHPQFGGPGNLDFTDATAFSQINGLIGNPRLLQLALKLTF